MTTGSCLCGGVKFRIDQALEPIQVCHCSQCRKAQGSAFAANIPVPLAAFTLLQGGDLLSEYESSPGKRRVFCRRCGSPLFSKKDATPGVVRIRAGTLDEPVEARPAFHFYVDSKASWWTIADALPQYSAAKPNAK